MGAFALYITTAIALIFVIEGLVYALFPDSIRRMMVMAISLPPEKLRVFGVVMILAGLTMVMVLQSLN